MATHLQDEIQYCARCGISFLWSREEQQRAGEISVPPHCPGCRQLLPAAGRERGQVKWYDPRKQYGFLIRAGQPDIYVHRSALSGRRMLRPGDLVEFRVEQTERGLAAFDVVIMQPENAGVPVLAGGS
jgi:CspA family cold shock protein